MNTQPQLFIDPAFWPEFMRNGFYQCVYRDRCASTECLGLSTAYIAKYGYEEKILRPIAARSPAPQTPISIEPLDCIVRGLSSCIGHPSRLSPNRTRCR